MSRDTSARELLVERARRGDRAAQQELWRQHRRWVAAIVLAHRPRQVEVDDLMQDVAVKLISRIDTLRDPALFRPWLRRIIINVCRGRARGLHTTLRLTDPVAEHNGHESSTAPEGLQDRNEPAEGLECRDAADRLLRHALSLPPDYREPLLLRCVQSLTYQQISEILELPVTTVETRLARARRMLRQELDELAAEEANR